jgi:hypothetical protein
MTHITKHKINYSSFETCYYLPCEITHYTSKLYYTSQKNIFPGVDYIKQYIRQSDSSIFKGMGYFQDSYVQLLNRDTKTYKNIFNLGIIDESDIETSTLICTVARCIIQSYHENRQPREIFKGGVIEFKPDERRILPKTCYITIKSKSQKLIDDAEFKDDEYSMIGTEKSMKYNEQNKGGNFISAPDGTIFCIEGSSSKFINQLELDTSTKLIQLNCNFKTGDKFGCFYDCFRHIDELMCFMPYGKDKFKIWFYDELDNESFNSLLLSKYKLYNTRPEEKKLQIINEKIKELNCERLKNLEIICEALFDKPYSECINKFVFFKFYSYLPSVLNRTWYETNDKCVCLFPKLVKNEKTDKIMLQICNEMKQVKSMINPSIKVDYHFIEVKKSNETNPEGTLHCLIKQRFIKPVHI